MKGRKAWRMNRAHSYSYSRAHSHSEKGTFCSVLFMSTAYIVTDYAIKIYISRFILQGRNIIFKNILRFLCSLRKIK